MDKSHCNPKKLQKASIWHLKYSPSTHSLLILGRISAFSIAFPWASQSLTIYNEDLNSWQEAGGMTDLQNDSLVWAASPILYDRNDKRRYPHTRWWAIFLVVVLIISVCAAVAGGCIMGYVYLRYRKSDTLEIN